MSPGSKRFRNSFKILGIFSTLLILSEQQQTKGNADSLKPLVFEFEKDDPQRVKIYWDPNVDVKKIKEISSRDVHYVINNATGKVREEYSPWLALVSEADDVDPNRRLLFVKSDMCVEQDYRASWYDAAGVLHENATQRMEPSPEPWKPAAKIELTNLRYDGSTKRIVGNLAWAMNDEKLKGIPKLGSLHPTVHLETCRTLFDKPVPLPTVDPASKIVSFDPLYAKHECAFTARLRQMTYNGELECRSLRQTTDDQSDRIELSCSQGGLNYPDCKDAVADQQPCSMSCEQQISAVGDYDWSRGWPRPFVKIEWKPRVNSAKTTVVSHLIRYAQVDSAYNNYPFEEFNVTFVEIPSNASTFKLETFSKDIESYYTFQVCTLYEACFATAKWSSVPKYPIYATTITDKLPPPPSTTATTSSSVGSTQPNNSSVNSTASTDTPTPEKGTRRPPRSPLDISVETVIEPQKSPKQFPETPVSKANTCLLDAVALLVIALSLFQNLF